ncbi:MAG: UDP-glucose--hexose-1-phosphate uridylyltransferase [Clostridiales bacterium]|jgi:UDPglucose--hexose-1-phosphate uridylyltransferase|nr:UDP-glucose--hexose-1-phosphate uridylyltransferase [Clostridiales bacterium]
MIIYSHIENLLTYAKAHLFLDELDVVYVRNRLLTDLKLTGYTEYEVDCDAIEEMTNPDAVLTPIVEYAVAEGVIKEDAREAFATHVMDAVSIRPSEVADIFSGLHGRSPQKAFDWLYDYAVKNDYVKQSRIAKNKHWDAKGTKGKLEVTINLSKPEKNNADIAAAKKTKEERYPACDICVENEGYCGHGMCRQNLRTIPLTLGGEEWFWQFSPYSYFNQHGIAVNLSHTPMKVNGDTVRKLLDFVDFAPAYFIGCNAALPIIGGSILTHDHFQGGMKQLPMHKAPILTKLKCAEYPYVDTGIVDWYNSVVRLCGANKELMIEYASKIIAAWETYTDESIGILAKTSEQHNGVTPVARKLDDKYVMDLIFRNNRTSEEFPDGIYHAHPEYHHIKREAIGLIEAMGLFILPGRLDGHLKEIEKYLTKEVKYSKPALPDEMKIYAPMIEKLTKEAPKCSAIEAQLNIKDEINRICEGILDNTAVFKKDEAGTASFLKFLDGIGIR